jgi:hypothetical protein
MWKLVIFTLSFIVVGSNAATAQTVEWRNGTAVVTSASTACRNNGINVGSTYDARYRHPNLGDNPNEARLALISRRTAHIFGKDGGFTNAFQTADFAGFIGGGLVTNNSAQPYQPQIRMTAQMPGNITATTPQIFMKFIIRRFFVSPGVNGCTTRLDVSVLK